MYYKSISEMWSIVVIFGTSVALVTAGLPTNLTRTESNSNRESGGGVCKADYGSRFNIDSKELGTTCMSKSSPGNSALSAKLKQAINRMKQDFEQLQDLIDQEVSLDEPKQDSGFVWTSGDLRVHREYPNEQNTLSEDKISLTPDSPPSMSYLRPKIPRDEINFINRPMIKSHRIFESSRPDEFPYENISKLKNDNFRSKNQFNSRNPIETMDFNKNSDIHVRDPFARQAYETRRVLADIRIDPEIHEGKKDLDSESSNSAVSNENREANTS